MILKIIGWVVLVFWTISVFLSIPSIIRNYKLYKINSTPKDKKSIEDLERSEVLKYSYGKGLKRSILLFLFEILSISIIFYFLVF